MSAMALTCHDTHWRIHICLQNVADVSMGLGYSHTMRHKKYVRAYPPLSDFSKLESTAHPHRMLRSARWWLPILLVVVLIMASCGGGSSGTSASADANAGLTNTVAVNPAAAAPSPDSSPNPSPNPSPNTTPSNPSTTATSTAGTPPSGGSGTTTTASTITTTAAAPGPAGALVVTDVATGLSSPWGMVFLPDSSVLVTEKAGTLRIVSPTGGVSAAISGVPAVDSRGQGGLLDVALDPAFATNQRIYLSYAKPSANTADGNHTAVARAVLNTATLALSQVTVIFEQLPKVVSTGHFGSRLVFDKNGYLFVTLGDRQSNDQRGFAQDLSRGHGKVARITTDGAPAPGNPSLGASAQPSIWSYGHRNPQGAALHPTTGQLWVNEHGAQGGDELNLALAGKNYGWPLASYSQEYGSTTPVGVTSLPGMTLPVSYWLTRDGSTYTSGSKSSIAPSGMAIYSGTRFPEFQGNVFLGALAGTALWRVVLGGADGTTEVFRERLLASRGERIRDVRVGPDGWIYLLTDNGKLLRVSK
jgi:aldose sugar dehydrogenase